MPKPIAKKRVFQLNRIEICIKKEFSDSAGKKIMIAALEDLGIKASEIRTIKAFSITGKIPEKKLKEIAEKVFADPILQDFSVNSPLAKKFDFDFLLEVAFKPGVTDNEARTARESIENFLGKKLNGTVHTSTQYLLSGISGKEAEKIATGLIANELIELWRVWPAEQWKKSFPCIEIKEIQAKSKAFVEEFNLNVEKRELELLSAKRCLALTASELGFFAAYLSKPEVLAERKKHGLSAKATDVELECFAQTQSEHCKHKVFKATIKYRERNLEHRIESLFKTFIVSATEKIRQSREKNNFCVSVFEDNAGIISFDSNWNIAFKTETHNAPSALDPYGGALTGIVGVNRDIIGAGIGAKPIFNTNILCFGNPFVDENSIPKGVLHPKRVFRGVRKGIEDGGNQSGIPTINGSIFFDESFSVRPLVFCGTGGIMPAKIHGRETHKKKAKPGDKIVMVGGRIGKDGIHGATFSSTAIGEESPSSAVQIGAPIIQKRMLDFLLEARDLCLYNSITDNGAGGLSSSVGEMALQSGGAILELEKAPLKYAGLQPWEILLSEAQERMTLAVPPSKLKEFLALSSKRGVEATVIGEFNNSRKLEAKYGKKTVLFLDLDFLHNGLPRMELEAEFEPVPEEPEGEINVIDFGQELKEILSNPNVCSKHWVVRQYDHEVQGTSTIKPLIGAANDGPSDAAVIKPISDSWKGLIVSNGINPSIGENDPYWMAANAIDEAIRNAVAVGANPERIALLDNFCWPDPKFDAIKNPEGKKNLGKLVRACRACYDFSIAFKMPFISGKDSLAGDREIAGKKYSIKPTLLVSALAEIEDVRKAVSMDAKNPGNLVYILGITRAEMQGSVFLERRGLKKGLIPKVKAESALALYFALHKAILEGIVESAHDCSQGGLAVALAETAFAGNLGIKASLSGVPVEGVLNETQLLFSESPSRLVVTVKPENKERFEEILAGKDFGLIGETTSDQFLEIMSLTGKIVLKEKILELKKAWLKTLDW
ncbi:MAG: phosphoribosylformylglycinamidine synthase subunit PurS [Candidatus Diapherotrites archaeon]